MPKRTSAAAVLAIIRTKLTETQVQPFIETASIEIDGLLLSVVPAFSATSLELIERWLTCHLIAIFDPRTMKESADGTSFTYEGSTGEGLSGSKYGQQVKRLDTSGRLSGADNPNRMAWATRVGNERDVEG